MADYTQTSINPTVVPANNYNPMALVNMPPGSPVFQSLTADGTVNLAKADAIGTARAVGVTSRQGIAGSHVHTQYAGPLTLTTDEWDAIAGTTGGLDQGAPYYLSAATAGRLTTTAPSASASLALQIGIALSSTTLLIQILPKLVVSS